jgi:hypothetical protein
MIAAFRELEEQYVCVGVLRTIFPEDFDRRDDRVRSLLIEFLGDVDAELLTGVAFRIVGGEIRFRVSRGREDGLVYLATRSSGALRSNREFVLPGDWMDYFFRVMSELIDA